MNKFSEVKTDHVDDNGVTHINGWKTVGLQYPEVNVIGYFISGEVYWTNPDYQFDPMVKEAVEELQKEEVPVIDKVKEVVELAIKALDMDDEFGNDIDSRHACEEEAFHALSSLKNTFK